MKNKLKMTLSLLMVTILTTSTVFGATQTGKLINGSTMIPLRGVFEELGFSVSWDGTTNTATLKDDEYTIILKQNNKAYTVNGVEYQSTVAPQIISGSTYIPLRTLGDKIGAVTTWDGSINTAYISYKDITSEINVNVATTKAKPIVRNGLDMVDDDPSYVPTAEEISTVSIYTGRTFSDPREREQYDKAISYGITDAQYDKFVANGLYNANSMRTAIEAGMEDYDFKADIVPDDAQVNLIDNSDSYKLGIGIKWN